MLVPSRPRILHLARRVSPQAIFIGVLLLLTSLSTIEGIAGPFYEDSPTITKATPGYGQVTLTWTVPAHTHPHGESITRYQYRHRLLRDTGSYTAYISTGSTRTTHTITGLTSGEGYVISFQAVTSENGPAGSSRTVIIPIPAPALTATLEDREVSLSWTAPPSSAFTRYELSQNGETWREFQTTQTTLTETLTYGISYTYRLRAVNTFTSIAPGSLAQEAKTVYGSIASVTVTPLRDAPGGPGSLNVERVDDTAILTWSPPNDAETEILRYEYSDDGGSTWKSTGSSDTTYTVTGLKPGQTYTFLIRAVYVDGTTSRVISHPSGYSNAVDFSIPKPRRRLIQECPIGWTRSDGFVGRTRRVLIYEVNVEMDMQDRVSIYKPVWVAIYVHPDEGLENLQGWKLQVALPYNRHRDYMLTAENSVVVDAGFVEGGFAFIANPEEPPFPMTGIGFTGAPAPGFDYRLYDDTGRRVDFGISCYKRGDIFQVLKDMEDPRVLRKVLLERFDWDASWFLRSEWTVPAPVHVPGAPSLQRGNLVGKWGDLKQH